MCEFCLKSGMESNYFQNLIFLIFYAYTEISD